MSTDPTAQPNSGTQIFGSVSNTGQFAVGAGASANRTVHNPSPTVSTASPEELAAAVRDLSAQLEHFRIEHPDALSEVDARDATKATDELGELDPSSESDRPAIDRRIDTIKSILGQVSAFARTVGVLDTVWQDFYHLR